jgi:hypothetical protein
MNFVAYGDEILSGANMPFIPIMKLCPHCITPYYVGDEKDCPTCGGNADFADGYLKCWFDIRSGKIKLPELPVAIPLED